MIYKTFKLKNGMILVVREGVGKDAGKLVEFTKKMLSETDYHIQYPHEFRFSSHEEAIYLDEMKVLKNSLFLIGEIGSEIAGIFQFQGNHLKKMFHTGTIGISVLKKFHNIGVGTALLKTFFEWCEKNPFVEVAYLEVFSNNKAAIKLYEKFGFKITGVKKYQIKTSDNQYIDMFLMTKVLKHIE